MDKITKGLFFVVGESAIVGIYVVVLFLVIEHFLPLKDWNLFLFVLGFVKHVFGYLLGIQNFYCIYGYSCRNVNVKKRTPKQVVYTEKMVESLLEGFAFVITGALVFYFLTSNKIYGIFITGFVLHIVAEITGVHKYYCETCTAEKT